MGKRELLLVVGFVLAGLVVYQVTAPPAAAGDSAPSVSGLLDTLRRHVRGNRAVAEVTLTGTHPLPDEVNQLRVLGPLVSLEVTGEDRKDVESAAHIQVNGYDDAEAQASLKQSRLVADHAGTALILRIDSPREGRRRGTLRLKVPRTLQVRVEPMSGELVITAVRAVELAGTRGDATVRGVAGKVEVAHRGGEVTIEDAGLVQVTGAIGTLRLAGIRGTTSVRLDRAGEIKGTGLAGPVEIDTRHAEIELDDLSKTRGPFRISINGGSLRMSALAAEARIDARNTDVTLAMAAAAPVAAYATEGTLTVSPPAGAFTLDALFIDSELKNRQALEALGVTVDARDPGAEVRAQGAVRGGGATLTLRATRSPFTLGGAGEAPPGR